MILPVPDEATPLEELVVCEYFIFVTARLLQIII